MQGDAAWRSRSRSKPGEVFGPALIGAMLFALWGGSAYRPTRDLDLMGYGSGDPEEILAALRNICGMTGCKDGLSFDPATFQAEPIRDDAEYHGLRIRFQTHLSGSRIAMQIDIGFGDAIEPPPVDVGTGKIH
jgi:hypothetical protein